MTLKTYQNQLLFVMYFIVSTVLTWYFVKVSPLYISQYQMLLSTFIAGGKWGIQLILSFFILKEKKWLFIKNIGWVCLIGSVALVPYILLSKLQIANNASLFVGSLIVSVLLMIWYYYKAVNKSGTSIKWWYFWLACLATAIALQLTVVFKVI